MTGSVLGARDTTVNEMDKKKPCLCEAGIARWLIPKLTVNIMIQCKIHAPK